MCDHSPNREQAMTVLVEPDTNGKGGVWCDPCLATLVNALNDGGLPTIASCCGHGTNHSSVALADGRWIVVMSDHEFRASDTRKAAA